MDDLAKMFADAGGAGVRTYIQSGNVVFCAPPAAAARIASTVAGMIAERFGFQAPIIVRSARELARVAAANPFLPGRGGRDENFLHVAFLAEAPDQGRIAALDPARSPGDDFLVRNREVYLHLPGGVARTRLTNAYFDATLATTSTMRNWPTVLKLVEMVQATA